MQEKEMIRKLNSVGKTIFVMCFQVFKAYSRGQISKDECIDILVSTQVSNSAGAAIRAGNALQLFRAKKENDALLIASESARLSHDTVNRAKQLLAQ